MDVICIAMELDVMFTKNMAKREKINNEQKGSKDRTLGNTRGKGAEWDLKLYKLSTAREI